MGLCNPALTSIVPGSNHKSQSHKNELTRYVIEGAATDASGQSSQAKVTRKNAMP